MDDPEEGNPPAKRRKKASNTEVLREDVFTSRPELTIRLTKQTTQTLGLKDVSFLILEKFDYISFNSSSSSYLYYLCSSIFEVVSSKINLLHSKDSKCLADDSDEWTIVEITDELISGDYLLIIDEDAEPNLKFDKIKSRTKGSDTAPSTPQRAAMLPPSQPDSAKSTSHSTNLPTTPINTTSSTSKDYAFRRAVVSRDRGCVVRNTDEDCCIMSHIIPRSLLKKNYVTAGAFTFTSEFDPMVAILLSPDLDFTFDRFLASISQKDGVFHWQIFRNTQKELKTSYPSTSWAAAEAKETVRIADYASLRAALQWHYRRTVIKCWGSNELRDLVFDFAQSDVEFAMKCCCGSCDIVSTRRSDLGYYTDTESQLCLFSTGEGFDF